MMRRVRFWVRALAVLGLVLTAYAFFVEVDWLQVTQHSLTPSGPAPQAITPQARTLRVVQVSDLHLLAWNQREKAILEKLKTLQPDVLILSGDVLSSAQALDILDQWLAGLPPTQTVATLGNWEHRRLVDLKALRAVYARHGATLLVNEEVTLHVRARTVRVVGVDDFAAGQPHWKERHQGDGVGAQRADFSLLVQHSPGWFQEVWEESSIPTVRYDLCLAGHTHGGQITFLGWVPWTPPGSGRFVSGFYDLKVCPLYVSKGVGTSVLPARFGARPEIAVFDW